MTIDEFSEWGQAWGWSARGRLPFGGLPSDDWQLEVYRNGSEREIQVCGLSQKHIEGDHEILSLIRAGVDIAPGLYIACKTAEHMLSHIDRLGEYPDTLKQMYIVRNMQEEARVVQILREAIALAEPGENNSEIPVDTPGK